jgi:hypothetical protein
MKYNPREHGITQSKLANFLQCRQRAKYGADGIGWVEGVEREALWFGSMIHWLLEQYHSGKRNVSVADWASLRNKSRSQVEFIPRTANQAEANLLYVGQLLFDGYKKKWAKVNKSRTFVTLESEFCVPFNLRTGEVVFLRGKRDGTGIRMPNGSDWLFETKTAARHNEDQKMTLLQFDFQCSFYLICTELERQKKVAGIWYNIIRKPGIVQLQRETVDEYRGRVAKAIENQPDYFFYQYEVAFTPKQKRKALEELTHIVNEFMDWYDDIDRKTYKNTASCTSPYTCGYIQACAKVCDTTKMMGMGELPRVHPELDKDNFNASTKSTRRKHKNTSKKDCKTKKDETTVVSSDSSKRRRPRTA